MPRTLTVSLSPAKAQALLQQVGTLEGVAGYSHQRAVSVRPPGDVVTVQVTNDGLRRLLLVLDELRVIDEGTIVTSEPKSVLSPDLQQRLERESNETVWEEMAFLLRQDTNLMLNYLVLMTLAGAIAAAGLWLDLLHVVIGSMLIAPAFEPLVRLSFGVVAGPQRIAWSGLQSTLVGYLMLAAGAAVMLWLLRALEVAAPGPLAELPLVRLWSSFTMGGLLTSALAAAAGAIVIAGLRPVLTPVSWWRWR